MTGNNTNSGAITIEVPAGMQVGAGGAGSTSGALGSGDMTINGTLNFNRSDSITVANNISGGGLIIQAGGGTGTLTLSGNNNGFSGLFQVNTGATLAAGSASALGTASVSIYGTGRLDLAGFSSSVTALNDDASGSGVVTNSGSSAATLTVNNSVNAAFSGTLKDGAATLGLTVAGSAALVLSGSNNTYSGATTVDSGATLQAGVANAFSLNSDFKVNGKLDLGGYSNAIGSLDDNGSGTGNVTNNGTSSPATLTVGSGGIPVAWPTTAARSTSAA